MKVLILSNFILENNELVKAINKFYPSSFFLMKDIIYDGNRKRAEDEQNKILLDIFKGNNNWILSGIPDNNLDFISSLASSIIYFEKDFKIVQNRMRLIPLLQRFKQVNNNSIYDNDYLREYFKKYSRKIYIIKNKKEYKKLIDAIEKGIDL